MIYINLLPVREIKQKLAAKQQIFIVLSGFLLLLLVLSGIGFFQISTATHLNNDISTLKNEKQKHANTLKLIKKLEKDKALIEKRIGIINELKKSSSLTVHILDEVANLTPTERMWLTSLTQKGTNLRLTGMALDNRTIAKFMEDLKSSPYITNVNLANSSLKGYAGRNLKAFSLTCTITTDIEKGKEQDKK